MGDRHRIGRDDPMTSFAGIAYKRPRNDVDSSESLASKQKLKDYLKRYESNSKEDDTKKKKKKPKAKPVDTGVLVVDEDPVWQKPVAIEEENDTDSADEEKPQVNEDIEVKRMRRLEEIRAKRPQNAISDDGSGWVTLSPKNSNLDNQNSDLSPPRKRAARNDTLSPEPDRNPKREYLDLSPPRRRARNDSPSPEPERRHVHKEVDLSPPHQWRKRQDTASLEPDGHASPSSDLSPPRKSRNNDLSPPRKNKKHDSVPRAKEQRKTGLITGQEMTAEIANTKKQDWTRFEEMDPSLSGRHAEPIYRDKIKGNRITKEEFLKSRKKVEEKPKEIKLEWGKGLAQKREAEARLEELELEKDKPFARTRDDPDLDRMLRDTVRWGDPMAHLVKKKQSDYILANLGDSESMRESGFIIPQDIPSHSWIKRGMDSAPNRYGIKPGRHWDGVDRSNGYEKEMFKRTNEKQATEREAYLWSVADM